MISLFFNLERLCEEILKVEKAQDKSYPKYKQFEKYF